MSTGAFLGALSHVDWHVEHIAVAVGTNAKLHERLSSSLCQQPLEGLVVEPEQRWGGR